jgi:hypothetical protein
VSAGADTAHWSRSFGRILAQQPTTRGRAQDHLQHEQGEVDPAGRQPGILKPRQELADARLVHADYRTSQISSRTRTAPFPPDRLLRLLWHDYDNGFDGIGSPIGAVSHGGTAV